MGNVIFVIGNGGGGYMRVRDEGYLWDLMVRRMRGGGGWVEMKLYTLMEFRGWGLWRGNVTVLMNRTEVF